MNTNIYFLYRVIKKSLCTCLLQYKNKPPHATRHNTLIYNILSTEPQLSSQKALRTLPDDGNVMPKHVGATIHNKLNE
jgi:hypothetical protein